MRAVLDALDQLEIRYFITGSVAASVHGVLRQSQDTDVVLDVDAGGFAQLASRLGEAFAIADPVDFGGVSMAAIVSRSTADKLDVILAPRRSFEASAMNRRLRADVPGLGEVWVASVEDLVLAKLVWSEGTSELQLRDCAQLLRLHAGDVDSDYLDRWAVRLGVGELLASLR